MFLCVLLEIHRPPAEEMGKEGGGERKKIQKNTFRESRNFEFVYGIFREQLSFVHDCSLSYEYGHFPCRIASLDSLLSYYSCHYNRNLSNFP